jgi:tetratricopeptide (TPR) repeat protein
MWWSFYESDATFENFVIRALAYVTGRAREEIAKTPAYEREEQLLAALNASPFLMVLDGLERILIAYSGMDAARQLDDGEFDKRTANRVAGAFGLPASADESFVGQHRLRQCIDPRAGAFLRKLARVRESRILVSTRLYPTELQDITGYPMLGCAARFISGLSNDDALNLWRAYGVSGSRDELLRMFHTFDNYPLLIRALAGEVAGYRKAPGDFDKWRAAHKDFDPYRLSLANARTHVLGYALGNLTVPERETLRIIAAFRMPAAYDTLSALLVGARTDGAPARPFATESELDTTLASLEDRGLLGWDRRANRYDLHPIVRGVTWSSLADGEKEEVYRSLHSHFESIPTIDQKDVNTFDDLTPAVELFNSLIGLGRHVDALTAFRDRLDNAMHYRLSASRRRAELLEALFPDGVDAPPPLSPGDQSRALNSLALAYTALGEPGRSMRLYDRAVDIDRAANDARNVLAGLCNSAYAKQMAGALTVAQLAGREALMIAREKQDDLLNSVSLNYLGQVLSSLGITSDSLTALRQSCAGFHRIGRAQWEGVVNATLSQRALWLGDFAAARAHAQEAWRLAHDRRFERDLIRAARLQGVSTLEFGDDDVANERLHYALTRARAASRVEEELPALTALAELRRRQGKLAEARELLDGVWDLAERGPYPLLHADARNVLAKVARDEGKLDEAVQAATRGYELSWCDGPPYAYHWGLEASKAMLKELGAPWPDMPPFDASKYPPMPDVEIEDELKVES